jgi:sugar/nucleoside kinase (ribokinase family)
VHQRHIESGLYVGFVPAREGPTGIGRFELGRGYDAVYTRGICERTSVEAAKFVVEGAVESEVDHRGARFGVTYIQREALGVFVMVHSGSACRPVTENQPGTVDDQLDGIQLQRCDRCGDLDINPDPASECGVVEIGIEFDGVVGWVSMSLKTVIGHVAESTNLCRVKDHRNDVVGIGNAIVDVISQESEQFLIDHELVKGSMTLIDAERADSLYSMMAPAIETSGGSAANTMAGLASFGGSASYIGKVRDDQLGGVFAHDIRAVGVGYDVMPGASGPPTARCLIVVTPDAARTMNTFLGTSSLLHPDEIDVDLVASAKVLYCEGYIWDIDITKQAIRSAVEVCRSAGNKVSFTLSDAFCVERHHTEWLELVDGSIDILFGNESELRALCETDDFDTALRALRGRVEIACLTRGPKGSVIVTAEEIIEIPALPVPEVEDTTGAGDLYASGFLYGYTHGCDLATCGRLASMAASEVISHVGARSLVSLADLAVENGVLR